MNAIKKSVLIHAPLHEAWHYLTDPGLMAKWPGEPEMEIEIYTDWKVGHPIVIKGFHHVKFECSGLVLQFDPQALDSFWNANYFPELIAVEKARYPTIEFIKNSLGGSCEVIKIPIPLNCVDGFQEAFYGRPEAFLEKEVRVSQSAWGF